MDEPSFGRNRSGYSEILGPTAFYVAVIVLVIETSEMYHSQLHPLYTFFALFPSHRRKRKIVNFATKD